MNKSKKDRAYEGNTIAEGEIFEPTTGEFLPYRFELADFAVGHGQGFAAFETEGPSLTRQEFAGECDINEIMKRNEPVTNFFDRREPVYMDLTDMPTDLQGTLNLVIEAEQAFMRLNANIRREFNNDAVQFVEFASDPGNLDQMREWGLAPPAPTPPRSELPAAGPRPEDAQPVGGSPPPPAKP